MKLAKLGLAGIIVAGLATSSYGADTLADAFKNGKTKGELRAWYFDRKVEDAPAKSADIINTAVILNYVTDKFYGFSLGGTFQSNFAPGADTTAKDVFKSDMYGSGAVLSEGYLGYDIGKTALKAGRQFISTPLVNGSGSRIVKESFEGATIINKDLPGTTIVGGYVDKFQGRTGYAMGDAVGDAPSFADRSIFLGISASTTYEFDGAYTIEAINKSIPNLTLTGQYLNVGDVTVGTKKSDIHVYFAEGKYVIPMDGYKLDFGLNHRGSKTDAPLHATTKYDGTYTAGKISISELAGFGASIVAATTSSDDAVIAGMGNGPSSYTATMIRASTSTLTANTASYRFDVTYDFSKIGLAGLKGALQHSRTNQNRVGSAAASSDYTSYAGSLDYVVPALKGLSLSVQYETQENKTTTYATNAKTSVDTDELRIRANYTF